MKEIPQEKVIERFESLPEILQDLILGDALSNFATKAASKNNLNAEQTQTLSTLLGDLIMGFSTDEEFIKEAQQDLNLQEGLVKGIAEEFKAGVLDLALSSVKSSLEKGTQPTQEENVPLRPIFAKEPPIMPQGTETTKTPTSIQTPPPQEEKPTHEAPFILHKEEEVEPTKEATPYSLKRPEFYKPTFSEEYKRSEQAQSTARIELGGEEIKKAEPRAERTSAQPSRIVHYSQFKTPLDSPEGAPETQPPSEAIVEEKKKKDVKPSEVHPNNIIDLKDLPLG